MSERSIEIEGPDVESAIETGLARLGVDRSEVQIEVVEEGRKGILGLGSREAIVRLTSVAGVSASEARREADTGETSIASSPVAELEGDAVTESEVEREVVSEATVADSGAETAERSVAPESDPMRQEVVEVATEIVKTLLEKMGFDEVEVSVAYSDPDDRTGRIMNIVQVEGDNLGALIGPHGETMDDLQYLARLMAGHALRDRADFMIDIDGYRERRREALKSLAQRMARKAVKRGRPITLEPMSAYDRRIIHITLRENDAVFTNSVGEGANRRVRIFVEE